MLHFEVFKSHGGGEFKKSGVAMIVRFQKTLGEIDHSLFADFLAVHTDSFPKIHNVRRSV